jgi:acyl transferase domain-containing protein
MAELSGSRTSVYAGSFTKDYDVMISKDLEHYPKYTVTGKPASLSAAAIDR